MFRSLLPLLSAPIAIGILLVTGVAETTPPPKPGVTARATVKRVIDGDTLEVVLHWPVTIRMKDCWAPETRGPERPEGLKSKAFLVDLLSKDGTTEGTAVIFSVDSKDADSLGDLLTFGRVVGTVWRPDDTASLSEIMVEAGKATRTKQK